MRARDLFDQVGEATLRAVIEDFYAHVFDDVMIGFLFEGKDQARLIEREYQFTAKLLGADIVYTGRPMREAHQGSPILGGHFERRMHLLREAISRHPVPAAVRDVWLAHTEALRAQVTRDPGSACNDLAVPPTPAATPTFVRLGKRST